MFASLISGWDWDSLIHRPWLLVMFAFQVWMFIDAVRRNN